LRSLTDSSWGLFGTGRDVRSMLISIRGRNVLGSTGLRRKPQRRNLVAGKGRSSVFSAKSVRSDQVGSTGNTRNRTDQVASVGNARNRTDVNPSALSEWAPKRAAGISQGKGISSTRPRSVGEETSSWPITSAGPWQPLTQRVLCRVASSVRLHTPHRPDELDDCMEARKSSCRH